MNYNDHDKDPAANSAHNTELDPNLVFVIIPKKDESQHDIARVACDLFNTKIGPFEFIPFPIVTYSAAKARNLGIAAARKTRAGKILCVDADMNFNGAHILRLCSRPERIVGGCYPKRALLDDVRWVGESKEPANAEGICDAVHFGAGFMKVEMSAIDDLIKAYPESAYLCDDDGLRGETVHQLFKEEIAVDKWGISTKPWARLLGEDFYFCWRARKCGIPVHWDTHCQIGHIGTVDFLNVYAALDRLTVGPSPHGGNDPVLPQHT